MAHKKNINKEASHTEVEKTIEDNKTSPTKKINIKDKEMTAGQFSDLIGVNKGTKFWASKSFIDTDVRKVSEWSKIFIEKGAISEEPAILKQKVSSSN